MAYTKIFHLNALKNVHTQIGIYGMKIHLLATLFTTIAVCVVNFLCCCKNFRLGIRRLGVLSRVTR
jgi:hypothetical protein